MSSFALFGTRLLGATAILSFCLGGFRASLAFAQAQVEDQTHAAPLDLSQSEMTVPQLPDLGADLFGGVPQGGLASIASLDFSQTNDAIPIAELAPGLKLSINVDFQGYVVKPSQDPNRKYDARTITFQGGSVLPEDRAPIPGQVYCELTFNFTANYITQKSPYTVEIRNPNESSADQRSRDLAICAPSAYDCLYLQDRFGRYQLLRCAYGRDSIQQQAKLGPPGLSVARLKEILGPSVKFLKPAAKLPPPEPPTFFSPKLRFEAPIQTQQIPIQIIPTQAPPSLPKADPVGGSLFKSKSRLRM